MQHRSKDLENAILAFAEEYYENNRHSPFTSEIAKATGSSRTTVYRYLAAMDANGTIEYDGKTIVTKKIGKTKLGIESVPLVGSISCGLPLLEEEHIEEYVTLPTSIFGKGDFFLLRTNGESMIEAGIDDGDLVLVRKQQNAFEGQIVVALVENENTLKRYFVDRENQQVILHPENKKMKDIIVNSCEIQGVAVYVFKALN